MGAAFVDVGLERAAFLHISDIFTFNKENCAIEALLHEGQSILVQVIRNPIGSKGARLTTQISIPSRYLVFIPDLSTVGISQRIDGAERRRLMDIVKQYLNLSDADLPEVEAPLKPQNNDKTSITVCISCPEKVQKINYGFIIRTAAEGVDEKTLQSDMDFLCRMWQSKHTEAKKAKSPALIYEELPLIKRTLRDIIGDHVEKIRIDSREGFQEMYDFSQQFIPELLPLLSHYTGERPIFDLHNVDDEISSALEKRVQLKSGGYLIIDQTEAMVTIDVNTGAFVGHRNLEETIFKTNLESVPVIARHLRLRNLGGIIILDFIDMQNEDHRRQVLRLLEKYLEKDQAKAHISEISSLGLVQMTRKRTSESLEHILCEICPTCQGRGSIKSAETVCYEIFREILREAREYDSQQFLLMVSRSVGDLLIDEEFNNLRRLEQFISRPIKFQVDPYYTQEQYDIVLI
jgi:ribonuclease G